MKKIILSVGLPTLVAIVLFTCTKQEDKTPKETTAISEAAIAVTLTEVKTGEYSLPIVSSGLVSTENEARLSFKAGGIISRIFVEEGQSVSKGQLLAVLDLTEIDAQVALTKNNLEKTKRDLDRAKKLRADSAVTLEQLQNLQTAFDAATESFRIASFNREFSSIKATTSGKVLRKFVNEGEQVSPGTPVVMINSASNNDWIVKIGLPDVDWIKIKKGDRATVSTDAYKESFDAWVSSIGEGAEPFSGLYPVEIKLKNTSAKLASGLFAEVKIFSSGRQSLKTIPIESVIEGSGKNAFVFVVNEDRRTVRKLPIKVAFLSDGLAYVEEGLTDFKEVISSGSAFLTESSTIQISK